MKKYTLYIITGSTSAVKWGSVYASRLIIEDGCYKFYEDNTQVAYFPVSRTIISEITNE